MKIHPIHSKWTPFCSIYSRFLVIFLSSHFIACHDSTITKENAIKFFPRGKSLKAFWSCSPKSKPFCNSDHRVKFLVFTVHDILLYLPTGVCFMQTLKIERYKTGGGRKQIVVLQLHRNPEIAMCFEIIFAGPKISFRIARHQWEIPPKRTRYVQRGSRPRLSYSLSRVPDLDDLDSDPDRPRDKFFVTFCGFYASWKRTEIPGFNHALNWIVGFKYRIARINICEQNKIYIWLLS